MSVQKSKVTLSFHPRERGHDLVTLQTANTNSLFHCEEIIADFYGQALSVSLSGFFDSGARVKGMLRSNTESKISVLRYLERELSQRSRTGKQKGVENARMIIEAELGRVANSLAEAKQSVRDVLKIYADDFDWTRENIKKDLRMFPKRYDRSLFYELPYSSISSFLSIETFNQEQSDLPATKMALSHRISFVGHGIQLIERQSNLYLATGINFQPSEELEDLLCYYRIRESESDWIDYEAKICPGFDSACLEFGISNLPAGQYEATVYLRSFYTGEIIWRSELGNNFQFKVDGPVPAESLEIEISKRLQIRKMSYSSYDSFSNWCGKYISHKGFGRYFLSCVKNLSQVEQEQLFRYYSQALKNAARRNSLKSAVIIKAFRLLGVSDVMMISPEGHHAMAGGLSQVIIGLSSALMLENCHVTIVSPIYHSKNGNHHESAENLLEKGVNLYGKRVELVNIGQFYLEEFGPNADTLQLKLVDIYEAKIDNLRLILIYNKELADRLYGGISGGDHLKRASFLSRAALEIINQDAFYCKPDVLLTNDWSTTLVRAYQTLSKDFIDSPASTIPLVHILHNAGISYQGRFNLFENGIRIWDNLGLLEEHLDLFLEEDKSTLNLSKAGCYLNSHGIMTVSRPYAKQLVHIDEKSELSAALRLKRELLFGISNGIPTQAVRHAAFKGQNWSGLSNLSVEDLKILKSEVKQKVQSKYELEIADDHLLAVLVGRLTEQKGLSLLTQVLSSQKAALQLMLEDCPKLQVIIAGPPSQGDQAFLLLEELSKTIDHELLRRCKFRFEFIPHAEAIELTTAADLFLMPSKYEPGGIAQLEALAVGTSVVAHRVGGLSATLSQYVPLGKRTSGNSFLFDSFESDKFLDSFVQAVAALSDNSHRDFIVQSAFNSRNDWRDRVPYYLSMFQKAIGLFDTVLFDEGRFRVSRQELLSKVSAKSQ